MPITTYTHCAPCWEQEVSLLLKLFYHFHCRRQRYTDTILIVRAFSPTAALLDRRQGARARLTFLAALILFIIVALQTDHK